MFTLVGDYVPVGVCRRYAKKFFGKEKEKREKK